MKITKSQLRQIIKEESRAEADSIAYDQDDQIRQENQRLLDKVGDALVKGKDATKWVLDDDEWQKIIAPGTDADTPEFIKAIETVLSDNLGTTIAELLGEGNMKLTKNQLRHLIKEAIRSDADYAAAKIARDFVKTIKMEGLKLANFKGSLTKKLLAVYDGKASEPVIKRASEFLKDGTVME